MTDTHRVSRRDTLKGLGAVGAAVVLGGATVGAKQQPADVVEVAASRMLKEHS